MARELAAVYSQIFHLATDLSVALFCDPSFISKENLQLNKEKVYSLCATLLPSLRHQNEIETSNLSLELQHLLQNITHKITQLDSLLAKDISPHNFFHTLHLSAPCDVHASISIKFYGNTQKTVKLALINDIEILFKRINSIFYCLPTDSAIKTLNEVISFMGHLRGVSPIPPPDAYLSSISCINCLLEAAMLPNQGESMLAMLASNVNCTHLCREVSADPVMGIFENEMRQMGLDESVDIQNEEAETSDSQESVVHMSLKALNSHTIFEKIDNSLLEISNLMYWNSGTKSEKKAVSETSHMAKLMVHESEMHKQRVILNDHLSNVQHPQHFFDCFHPSPLETLFCGGLFNSIEDTICALQKDCSTTFLKKSNYQHLIKKQNELFVRLNDLLKDNHQKKPDDTPNSKLITQDFHMFKSNSSDVLKDAQIRRDYYLQKITKDGLRRLHDCIEAHGKTMKNVLTLRVWGSCLYDSASTLINHFLLRKKFLSHDWVNCLAGSQEAFDNSKYIKNAIHSQKLSHEHIDSLIVQFYGLVTGPLIHRQTHFPIPSNVALAYCLDAAGAMPHQKLLLTEMIWPSIQTKDWVDTKFNQFYTIENGDLNTVQKKALCYIREAVLSVSLYNIVWEKQLKLFSAKDILRSSSYQSGIYLTYEETVPLVLIFENRGFIFKDLYALLYHHLQLTGQ
nr:DNA packaging terminase subunit 2 [Macronycteris gammaherpesvirus 1]